MKRKSILYKDLEVSRAKEIYDESCKNILANKIILVWIMKSCMKEAREAAEFLRDEKNDIEEWQLAGINAMFDQCNKENMVPYDMPTAIKGLLCMQYQ